MMRDYGRLILGEEDSQTAPVCNGTVREMVAEIDRLKAELEEGQQERENLRSHIYGLRGVVENLEQQLAEARTEVEDLKALTQPGCCGVATCPGVAEARQDAAREILTEIEKYYVGGKHDYYHITTEDLIGIIKAKFRLEG